MRAKKLELLEQRVDILESVNKKMYFKLAKEIGKRDDKIRSAIDMLYHEDLTNDLNVKAIIRILGG